MVLCMDEKTSIQALDHTQASLPMTKGRAGTMTSDYKRDGTTTLFAALNTVDGTVIGSCMDKHRHEEFLKFLRTVDTEVPKGLAVYDSGQLRHPQTQGRYGLARQASPVPAALHPNVLILAEPAREVVPRAHRQGTTPRRITLRARPDRRHRGILKVHNNEPKAFVWTATAESILTKVRRGRVALNQAVSQ